MFGIKGIVQLLWEVLIEHLEDYKFLSYVDYLTYKRNMKLEILIFQKKIYSVLYSELPAIS